MLTKPLKFINLFLRFSRVFDIIPKNLPERVSKKRNIFTDRGIKSLSSRCFLLGKPYWSAQKDNPPIFDMDCSSITENELTKSFKKETLANSIFSEKIIPLRLQNALLKKALKELEDAMEEHPVDFKYKDFSKLQLAIIERYLRKFIIKGFSLRNAHKALCHLKKVKKVTKPKFLTAFKEYAPRNWLDDRFLEDKESHIILEESNNFSYHHFIVCSELPKCLFFRFALSVACQFAMRLGVSIVTTEAPPPPPKISFWRRLFAIT